MEEKKVKQGRLVFIVDDEPEMLSLIGKSLFRKGFDVEQFLAASFMLDRLAQGYLPDLLILDLMLPDRDGIDVCRVMKKNPLYTAIPVIIVSARVGERDVVQGLDIGADDYISKPFSCRELLARVNAVLRRCIQAAPAESPPITINDLLCIDAEKFEVVVKGRKVHLTSTEFMILKMLAQKQGRVYSREKILNTVWGDTRGVFGRTVDVHIKHLRDKLGPAAGLIKNIRGVGYKLEL